MFSNLINLIIIMMISMILMFICLFLSKKNKMSLEKISTFECGFNPKSKARLPFSIHFFLITIIFLVFDVEITLILPMIITWKITNLNLWLSLMIFFMYLLMMELFYEWTQGMLKWTN
uniref:NADH-ubiquinone oxidoreductase chain 3 n=1 Tax=Molanna truncata TaxID=2942250 RepID=A0A9E8LP10_9NEOP|nr:NADH dehydrogenase subunit 3 [Molanna truncata]UZZ44162.1 NADH dehydrogenase subunit 3 [Molanna truncata]